MFLTLSKIKDNLIIKKIQSFLYSDFYYAFIVLIMAISNVFALDFLAFYTYAVIVVFTILFCYDTYPLVAPTCSSYMIFSSTNNPAGNYKNTIFEKPSNKIQFIVLCAVVAIFVLAKLILVLIEKIKLSKSNGVSPFSYAKNNAPKLTKGFLLLGVSYVLGGIFTNYYSLKTAMFGFVEILSLCFFYFYYFITVDWSKRKESDILKLITCIGFGLSMEVIGLYLNPKVIESIFNGTFNRGLLQVGWGVYNNLGCMLVVCIPAPIYFTVNNKKSFIYQLISTVFLFFTMFTHSRGSILLGSFLYLLSLILSVCFSQKEYKKQNIFNSVILVISLLSSMLLLNIVFPHIFKNVISVGMYSNGRIAIYKNGFKQFLDNFVFGNGFYQCTAPRFGNLPNNSFLPPRYHNTIIQLLASGGIVAFISYIYHRYETVKLVIKDFNLAKLYAYLCILGILLTSILDCNFFNFGPGLTYSVLLIGIEKLSSKNK